MSTVLNFGRDINDFNANSPAFTDICFRTNLAAGVAQALTIPATSDSTYRKWLAKFSYSPVSRVFVGDNIAATVPGGAFALNNAPLNPDTRTVKPGDVLSFITPDATAFVTVELYAIAS